MLLTKIVLFAVVGLLLYFYFFVWQMRVAARRILESVRKNFTPHRELRIIGFESLPAETAGKYTEARAIVESMGLKFVCYAEDETFTKANNIMIPFQYFRDEKGEVKASTYFHPKVGYNIYDFMTEISDGRQLTTSNAVMAAKIIAPPICVRNFMPAKTAPEELLKAHHRHLEEILSKTPGITITTAVTPGTILERYSRDNKIRYEFQRDRGWISLEELIKMSPKGGEGSAKRIHAMIQKIIKDEDKINLT